MTGCVIAIAAVTDPAEAERVAAQVATSLHSLGAFARTECAAEPHWHDPHHHHVVCLLGAADAAAAPAAVVALRTAPEWEDLADDGYDAEAGSRRPPGGEPFLADAVECFDLILHPARSPRRRIARLLKQPFGKGPPDG